MMYCSQLESTSKKHSTVEDRYDRFERTVAMKMRGLEKRQSSKMDKEIHDLLFEAKLGITLTSHENEC